jgi:hypothetical protein
MANGWIPACRCCQPFNHIWKGWKRQWRPCCSA